MKKALALLIVTALSVLAQVPKPSGSGGSGGGGSGTVTETQAGTGITVTNPTTTPLVAIDDTVIPTFTSDTADASGNCSLGTLWIRTDNGKTWWCTTTNTWTRVAELDADGRIVAAMMPALTGDVTTSAGAVATSVVKIQGRAMASTAPSDGQAIVWDNANTTWKPGTVSGGGSAFATKRTSWWVSTGHASSGVFLMGDNFTETFGSQAGLPATSTLPTGEEWTTTTAENNDAGINGLGIHRREANPATTIILTIPTAETGVIYFAGLSDQTLTAQMGILDGGTAGVYAGFMASESGSGLGNWQCRSNDGGADSGTTTDSGVAVSTANVTLYVAMDTSGNLTYRINGTQVCESHTTNLPTATSLKKMAGVRQNDASSDSDKIVLHFIGVEEDWH